MNNRERMETAVEQRLKKLAAYQAAAKTPEGKLVLEHLREVCGADKSCYRPGDPHATSFVCGLRDAYLLMSADAERDLSLLAEKLKPREDKDVHDQR